MRPLFTARQFALLIVFILMAICAMAFLGGCQTLQHVEYRHQVVGRGNPYSKQLRRSTYYPSAGGGYRR